MKISNIIRFSFLGIIWLWLAVTIILRGGVTLLNLFWIGASGVLVFVPLWKKYVSPQTEASGSSANKTNCKGSAKRK